MNSYQKPAQTLWDYLRLDHRLKRGDCLLVLGSNDIRVAQTAATLYLQGYAPLVIFSGGLGRLTQGVFTQPEAETFAQIAIENGVPRNRILLETCSANTGENIIFTQELMEQNGIFTNKIIVLTKPYLTRRAFATCKLHWPNKDIIVSSPAISFSEYPNAFITKNSLLRAMIGEIERLKTYPNRGFHIHQEIPSQVFQAYLNLIKVEPYA